MIMSGATPRLLGAWSGLGLLGLSALLLPVNATWAQKPEKQEQIQAVVTLLDDLSSSSDAVARVGEEVPLTVDYVGRTIAGDDNSEVHLVLRNDDSSDEVIAGSLKEAIGKLNDQIEKLGKQPSSEKNRARLKSLTRALEELQKAAKQIHELERGVSADSGTHETRVVRLNRVEDLSIKKLSDKQKAEIERIRSTVKKLAAELQAKQKELAEARNKLAKLEGVTGQLRLLISPDKDHRLLHLDPRDVLVRTIDGRIARMELQDVKRDLIDAKTVAADQLQKLNPLLRRIEVKVGSADQDKKGAATEKPLAAVARARTAVTVKTKSEKQRIEEIERKLKGLLQELDTLKKQRELEGAK